MGPGTRPWDLKSPLSFELCTWTRGSSWPVHQLVSHWLLKTCFCENGRGSAPREGWWMGASAKNSLCPRESESCCHQHSALVGSDYWKEELAAPAGGVGGKGPVPRPYQDITEGAGTRSHGTIVAVCVPHNVPGQGVCGQPFPALPQRNNCGHVRRQTWARTKAVLQ